MRSVVITGSTRGIGFGLAREFGKRGLNVAVSGRSQDAVDGAVAALQPVCTGKVVGAVCEVSSNEDLANLWDTAARAFGRVDVWINNAGISHPRKPLVELGPDVADRVFGTNINAALHASTMAFARMEAQGGGWIFNMEGFGSRGEMREGISAYGASKRALTYLTQAMAKEAAGSTVRVCLLSPGIVLTDLLLGDYADDPEGLAKSKRFFNILGDKVETVTPFLVEQILKQPRNGAKIDWMTTPKAIGRFLLAPLRKRDLFASA